MRMSYLFALVLLLGCEKLVWTPSDSEWTPSDVFLQEFPDGMLDSLGSVMSNDVLERAYQMATMEWTPVNPVPMNGGRFYSPGKTVTGIPYSSVKEINTYLFQDVSYHTFMTAVHNPKSVLYTQDISKAPYHGENCAPYYGAVCSSAVMCAFGISTPYYVSQIIRLPSMERIEDQVIDSLKVCDVIAKPGHVQLVFEMEYKSDTLFRITTFESSERSAHLSSYSKEQFLKMWEKGRYVGYRYKNLKYSEDEAVFRRLSPVFYNEDLCPSKGDKAVYRTTDNIILNIFNTSYDKIVLRNEMTKETATVAYHGEDVVFSDLQPGIYFAYLQRGSEKSAEVSFEVIETSINCFEGGSGDCIIVNFHSSADPVYAAFCDLVGNSIRYYHISAEDKAQGFVTLPKIDRQEYYCKIIFKGEYGRIINEPIRIQ